jgi:hypothetical protein
MVRTDRDKAEGKRVQRSWRRSMGSGTRKDPWRGKRTTDDRGGGGRTKNRK